jgi:hypothetical protein
MATIMTDAEIMNARSPEHREVFDRLRQISDPLSEARTVALLAFHELATLRARLAAAERVCQEAEMVRLDVVHKPTGKRLIEALLAWRAARH